MIRNRLAWLGASIALAFVALSPAAASAATGVCDSNPPTSTQACISAIQNAGTVVNDIFKDANGLTAQQLPVFGKLFNQWPGCDMTITGGCSGQSNPPYDCPGQYTCTGLPNTFANASSFLNALDRKWWQPCRITDHTLDANGCPKVTCIADGVGGHYYPWEGLVFDLGGPSNKVAIFAENDHGPQPCESTEYTVYLSDNPLAKDLIVDPKTTGVDPQKWNRAVLTAIYTKGFVEVRPPDPAGHAACGDTSLYSVEEDSFVSVYALPCGITFRYASIIAGNDGLDFPECGFESQEAELDAVAGLTEGGAAVCPDNDGDLFVDCNCPGAPAVCDCNDSDTNVHPGAPEACDAPDLNCDGAAGSCPASLSCHNSVCLSSCDTESQFCPAGQSCQATPSGKLCVPQDCTSGGCPAGSVCSNGVCVAACNDIKCPGDHICKDGQCIDPCSALQCPSGQVCMLGKCHPPCSCFAGDSGCTDAQGTVCDAGGTNACVPPACKGVSCPAGQSCDATSGMCVSFCNANVKCPQGQKCMEPKGCVPLCEGVSCPTGLSCNPDNGMCEDVACKTITCFQPQVCVMGQCVDPSGSGTGGSGGMNASGSGGANGAGGGNGAGGADPGDKGSCGCRAAGTGEMGLGMMGLLLGLGALSMRRRRR